MRLIHTLFLSILCILATDALAQEYNYQNKDTTMIIEGCKLEMKQLSRPISFAASYYDEEQPQHVVKYTTNLDSAVQMMPPKVKIPFERDTTSTVPRDYYLSEIICENGMKILFRDYVQFERYYPRENVIKLQLGQLYTGAIDLKTGEDVLDPLFVKYAESKTYRVCLRQSDWNNEIESAMLQAHKMGSKEYIDLIDLTTLFDQKDNIDTIFWIQETLFFNNGKAYWSITLPEPAND